MRYMLLIYGDESAQAAASPDEQNAVFHPYADYTRWLTDKDVGTPQGSSRVVVTLGIRRRRPDSLERAKEPASWRARVGQPRG